MTRFFAIEIVYAVRELETGISAKEIAPKREPAWEPLPNREISAHRVQADGTGSIGLPVRVREERDRALRVHLP